MYKIVLFLVVATFLVQDIESCCCVSREPYMSKVCLDCLYDLCPGFVPSKCGCDCFKDIANPCLASCGYGCSGPSYGCGCSPSYGCGCGKSLYYPEVEYPVTSYNMNPFYYGSCFGY